MEEKELFEKLGQYEEFTIPEVIKEMDKETYRAGADHALLVLGIKMYNLGRESFVTKEADAKTLEIFAKVAKQITDAQ